MFHDRSADPVPSTRLLGTCAHLAASTGLNPTLLRAIALVALLVACKLTIVVYCMGALAFRLRQS